MFLSANSIAENDDVESVVLLPSEALLEFLIEFEGLDDETLDMVIEKGRSDVEQSMKSVDAQQSKTEELKENE